MFCTQCGNKVEKDEAFCTKCGAPVSEDEGAVAEAPESNAQESNSPTSQELSDGLATVSLEAVNPASPENSDSARDDTAVSVEPVTPPISAMPTPVMSPSVTPPVAPASANEAAKPAANKKTLIIVIAAIAVVAVVAILAFVILSGSLSPQQETAATPENTEAQPAAVETTEVPVSFTGSGYAPSASTPIWLEISGTDGNDERYQNGFAIDGSSKITLPLGSYEAKPAASPLSGDGTLFRVTPQVISFVVSATGTSQQLSWNLAPINPADITDEELTAAVAGAESAGIPATEITTLHEKVVAARNQAKEAAKAEEANKQPPQAQTPQATEVPQATSNNTWYVRASDFVTLRSSPSTNAAALVKITSRQPVQYIRDAGNGWSEVSYGSRTGYVLTRFISKDPNASLDYGDV